MAMTVAEHDTAVAAYRQALTVIQQQIHPTAPGLASGIRPCIDRPQLRLASDDRVWLLFPMRCDPLTGPGGWYVLPPSAAADLRRITAAGIEFHTMVVGHEIVLKTPVRQLIPQLRDGPRSCLPDLPRALAGPVPADPRAAQLARCMSRAITAVTRGVPALAREAAGRLDPVIFGLIGVAGRLEPGQPALWVACTKWEW